VVPLVPILVAPLSIGLLTAGDKPYWLAMIVINLATFLLLALLCHGELYRRRPTAVRLTEFYLWVSFGGVLGGIFAALVAPYVFNRIYEYPILLLAALFVLPGMIAGGPRRMLTEAGPVLGVAALAIAAQLAFDIRLPAADELPFQAVLVGLAGIMLLQRHRPARFFALATLAFVVTGLWQPGFNRIESLRSFFGVHQLVETSDDRYRLLYHGTTLHGAEHIRAAATAAPEPLTYFYFGGPISESIEAVRATHGELRDVAVVGLGTGSLACHRRGQEAWTFYEIDPDVVRIARDPRSFSFLSSCAPGLPIVLGDARLTLAASPQRYDLIVLDAFSSDVIPVHLLTREAMAGYLAHLAPGGALVMHISNRHMELARVVAAVGAAEGLVTYLKEDRRPYAQPTDFKMNALVAVLARERGDLGVLPSRPDWQEIKPDPRVAAWTDDYQNIFGAILRKKFGW
jgi:predicted O-methyltransferase YrrM